MTLLRNLARVPAGLDQIPYWLLALPLRLAIATVFWNSAQAHAADWATTLDQFATDFALPVLPPVPAAWLTVIIEYATPPLLVLGLATRLAALVLLGMVAVIEIFVFPQAWPTHIQWAAMLLILIARGPGLLSLDAAILRRLAVGSRTPLAAAPQAGR